MTENNLSLLTIKIEMVHYKSHPNIHVLFLHSYSKCCIKEVKREKSHRKSTAFSIAVATTLFTAVRISIAAI